MISLNDFDVQFEDLHIRASIYFHSIHAEHARRLAEIVTKHLDRLTTNLCSSEKQLRLAMTSALC